MTAALTPALLLSAAILPLATSGMPACDASFWRLRPALQTTLQMQGPGTSEGGGYLGVRLADIDAERARVLKLGEERGVEIKAVMEGGPADKGGIQPGDVLLTYNGEQVLGAQHLSRLVQETPPGRKVKVQYWREGKTQTAAVIVGTATVIPNPFQRFQGPNWQAPNMDFPTPLLIWQNSMLGLEFERVDSQLAAYFGVKSGVLVRSVQRGLPAERAGLHAGDVIFSVAQQPLTSEHDFSSLLRRRSSVPVSVMRDHKRVDLVVNVP